MIEVTEYARQILLSADLQDKLAQPERLSDQNPQGMAALPMRPARAGAWDFVEHQSKSVQKARSPFPKLLGVAENPQRAGDVFHFFANHELLALELMAWVLLRFPEMPRGLRLGLAATMREEQKHLSLYLGQMESRGVELGDLSMSGHFWNTLAGIQDPREFLAGMSLTFEQANLDFARDWRDGFDSLGMQQEAAVMQVVYEEEIGHVKHGLHWLRALDEEQRSDWDLHHFWMPAGLQLSKARGETMDREARREAGLSDAYMDQLELAGGSKGRSPDLIWMAMASDLEWAGGPIEGLWTDFEADCAGLGALWASSEDLVQVVRLPSAAFQRKWKMIWGETPLWIDAEGKDSWARPILDQTRKLRQMHVWAWTPRALALHQRLAERWSGTQRRSLAEDYREHENLWWRYGSKSYGSAVMEGWRREGVFGQLDPLSTWDLEAGRIYGSRAVLSQIASDKDSLNKDAGHSDLTQAKAEVLAYLEECLSQGQSCIVKAAYGASGRGRLISAWTERSLWDAQIETLLEQGEILVEPFRDRVLDLSALFEIEDQGVRLVGVTRFDTDARGTWRGSWVSEVYLGMDAGCVRFLRETLPEFRDARGRAMSRMDVWTRECGRALQALHEQGLRGPVGVDALVWRDPQGALRLRPWVELNARRTFGHVALRLRRRIAPGVPGRLRLRRLSTLRKLGFENAKAWEDSWADTGALQKDSQGRFVSGMWVLSDPEFAKEFVPVLEIGSQWTAMNRT
jgi:uncharacterized ferritin-like protein (DUF455 family)